MTAWLITKSRKDRNKIEYLRNEVAQLRELIIKAQKYGKEKTEEGEEN